MSTCPKCQSTELEHVESPADWFVDVLRCIACGHRWAVN